MRNALDELRSDEAHLSQAPAIPASARPRSASSPFPAPALFAFTGRMRLRTKFLLSLALVTVALTAGTLLAVRQSLQAQARRQVEQGARNALLTFQRMAQQQRSALGQKAELLATLAFMRHDDATALQDASRDPWQSEDDLFALIDAKGKITALHTRASELPPSAANQAIGTLLRSSGNREWWING